jgi:hypothetical protein
MIDPVAAELFYRNEEEKIKINWFCYEYGNLFFEKIKKSRKLDKYRQRHSKEEIARFCAHFSLAMKKSIDDHLRGITDATLIDDEYIYEFYPRISAKVVDAFAAAAGDAWEEMFIACVNCPTRCISERYAYTDMFDRLYEE